jgi:hypothetical protein
MIKRLGIADEINKKSKVVAIRASNFDSRLSAHAQC